MGPVATGPSESRPRMVAVAAPQLCKSCGVCEDSCPVGAIVVEDTLNIDRQKCDGCGECLEACPLDALSMCEV